MAYELTVTLAEKPTPVMIRVLQRLALGREIANLMGGLAWEEPGEMKGMGEFVRFLRPPEVKALGTLVAVGAITHPGGGDFFRPVLIRTASTSHRSGERCLDRARRVYDLRRLTGT